MLDALPREETGLRAARRDDDGVARFADLVELLTIDPAALDERDADALDTLELEFEQLVREASARDDLLELAADAICIVVDRDIVALAGELPGRREAGDAAADDADLLARLLLRRSTFAKAEL